MTKRNQSHDRENLMSSRNLARRQKHPSLPHQMILAALIFSGLHITRQTVNITLALQSEPKIVIPGVVEKPTEKEVSSPEIINRQTNTVSQYLRSDFQLTLPQQKNNTTTGIVNGESVDMNRAIVAICMGKEATESKIVERFVWSAVHKGKFKGPIVIITDAPTDRYSSLKEWTDKFITITPPKQHFSTDHKWLEMARKRFKTYVLEYMELDPRLDKVKKVYYLDVDIVFSNSLDALLFDSIEVKHQIGFANENSTSLTTKSHEEIEQVRSKIWMFRGNNKHWTIQGGQMILDRTLSQGCLERWRWHMDHNLLERKDQVLLNAMIEEQHNGGKKKNVCEIVPMEQENYIEFPEKNDIVRVGREFKESGLTGKKYAPLVHIRNTAEVKSVSKHNWRRFVQDILEFKDGRDPFEISKKMVF